jgi:hypothetical protein
MLPHYFISHLPSNGNGMLKISHDATILYMPRNFPFDLFTVMDQLFSHYMYVCEQSNILVLTKLQINKRQK